MKRRIAKVVIGSISALALTGVIGSAAWATYPPSASVFTGNGVNIRNSPGVGAVEGAGYDGQTFANMSTWCTGYNVGGDYWLDLATDLQTGVSGYAADYYIGYAVADRDWASEGVYYN